MVTSNALPIFMLMCMCKTEAIDDEAVEMLTLNVTKVTEFGNSWQHVFYFIQLFMLLERKVNTEHSINHVPNHREYRSSFSQDKAAGISSSHQCWKVRLELSQVLCFIQGSWSLYERCVLNKEFVCNSFSKYASWKMCCQSFVKINNIASTLPCEE